MKNVFVVAKRDHRFTFADLISLDNIKKIVLGNQKSSMDFFIYLHLI